MKKVIALGLLITVLAMGSAQAFWSNMGPSPISKACYHVVDGVRMPSPYFMVTANGTCPPCSAVPACDNEDKTIEAARKGEIPLSSVPPYLRPLSRPGVPPHLCQEEEENEW